MTRSPLVALTLLGASLAVGAAGAARIDRSVPSPGDVTAVDRSGATIGFASGPVAGDCDGVRLWNLGSRAVIRLGRPRPCGDLTSTGRGIAGLAVSSSRALWISFAGGNRREWSLWTATTTSRTPRLLAAAERDVDDPAPMAIARGRFGVLLWSLDATVTGLTGEGRRSFRVTLGSPVRALAGGDPKGASAALLADGDVVVLSSAGALLRRYDYEPSDVRDLAIAGVGVLVLHSSGLLEIRRGASIRTVQLPRSAVLHDFAEGVLLYSVGRQLHVRALSGRDVSFRQIPSLPVRAALDSSGLAYAGGRRVFHVSGNRVAAALAAG